MLYYSYCSDHSKSELWKVWTSKVFCNCMFHIQAPTVVELGACPICDNKGFACFDFQTKQSCGKGFCLFWFSDKTKLWKVWISNVFYIQAPTVVEIGACPLCDNKCYVYFAFQTKQSCGSKGVTRPFCLVESHIVKTLLKAGVLCFTSYTFCNNNGSCSLRLNERICFLKRACSVLPHTHSVTTTAVALWDWTREYTFASIRPCFTY